MVKKVLSLFTVPITILKNRRCIAALLLAFFGQQAFSQTNISGIVNSYYRVLEVIPAKACVRLNSVTGLARGDRTLLVQMKGVTINTANASTFGDTTSMNNAGNYEMGTICYIRGDSVFFVYVLLNQYTQADKVQLVRVPQYVSANIVDTLKAAPWNGATGTGGVLAIFVEQDLTLNAPVYGDKSGYRGGANTVSDGTCGNFFPLVANGWYYNGNNAAPQNGAFKGEGAVEIAASQSGGRGAPANGGGGGNNHNNGGAGGANLASGGDGGGNSSTAGGCTGTYAGKAGKALSSYNGRKIFMGGGGGAGHGNNGLAVTSGGGHGGGIVFLRANNIVSNGYSISANGQTGGPALSDGASGGGAGGSIILNANAYVGPINIQANGGDGGTENDGGNIGRCYGAGGGGSGGVIYFSGSTPPGFATVNGGIAGSELSRDASCAAAVLPSNGASGSIVNNYSFSSSNVLTNNYCSILLPAGLLSFSARNVSGNVSVQWVMGDITDVDHFELERSINNNIWMTVSTLEASSDRVRYQYKDISAAKGINRYRLKIVAKGNTISYSQIEQILVESPGANIRIYPNPASDFIHVTGMSKGGLLSIADLSGKKIFTQNIPANPGNIHFRLPALQKGVYVINVGSQVQKLIVR